LDIVIWAELTIPGRDVTRHKIGTSSDSCT
jgi:hypothetical protein